MSRRLVALLLSVLAVAAAAGCSDGDPDGPAAPETTAPSTPPSSSPSTSRPGEGGDQRFPDVIAVEVEQAADGTARFDVTVSSPYDTPQRYADAWRIVGPDGEVLGVRELAHDHAGEQPFTRSLDGVAIPDGVAVVTVEGRDSVYGWGGATVDADL